MSALIVWILTDVQIIWKIYLEFSDESKNSHKFYEVKIEENKVITNCGIKWG